jgi:integrase
VSNLDRHVQDYLALRRGLGFKLHFPGQVLPQLAAYLDAAGASTVTAELAIAWAGLPQGVQPISLAHRLGAARGFARYLATIDPATEVPPRGVWPCVARRPAPYLWADTDIEALLNAARGLRSPLRAATHEALFGLLATSGMRVGEALGLGRDDIDPDSGVVTIREAKLRHSRLVPLHATAIDALGSYASCRDRLCPKPPGTTFFVSSVGTALGYAHVRATFIDLTTAIGLRTTTLRPRIHDLRNSFAVRTLVEWHRSGVDIEGRMAVLSTYLGHVNPAGTYWYLSASPELMELAAARLDSRYGTRP